MANRSHVRPQPQPQTTTVVVDEITLDGQKVRVQNADLPLDVVRLDPRNPRIANTVELSFRDSEDRERQIEELLWSDDDVRALYRQVQANHGLIERIIVRADNTVAEGNCRTVVYRKLRKNFPKDPTWSLIPARILPTDIGDRGIAILLGEMHVAGKNTWSSFEKAGHVFRMHKDFLLSQDEIAQRLRMSKSKVNQLIRAFELMKRKYLPKFAGQGSVHRFSHFEELFKKPELRDWVASNPGAEDLFVRWVGENRIPQGVLVRDLPQIIGNEEAVRALTEQNFEAAQRVLAEDDPSVTSKLFKRMVEMTDALRRAQLDDIQRVRKSNRSRGRQIVMDLAEALDHFLEMCEIERR